MLSAWIAKRLPDLPTLALRAQPQELDPTFPQPLLTHDLMVDGESVQQPIHCAGWYAGHHTGMAYLTDLKTVAWAMSIGLRVGLLFAETEIGRS